MSINNKHSIIFALLVPIVLLFVVITITCTFAKYMHTTILSDSAKVAKFGVEISEPVELKNISDTNPFEHSFSDKNQTIAFEFKITNNGEVPVICTPYFDINIQFYIRVGNETYENLIVNTGETVFFQIFIMSDGLTAEAITTNLVLDIEQLQGG